MASLADVLREIRALGGRRSLVEWLLGKAVEAAAAAAVSPQPVVVTDNALAGYEDSLWAVAEIFGLDAKPSITAAKKLLRGRGAVGARLASRLGRVSKVRNSSAHPDEGLADAIRGLPASPPEGDAHSDPDEYLPEYDEALDHPDVMGIVLGVLAPAVAAGTKRRGRRGPRRPFEDPDDALLDAAISEARATHLSLDEVVAGIRTPCPRGHRIVAVSSSNACGAVCVSPTCALIPFEGRPRAVATCVGARCGFALCRDCL